MNGFLPIIKPEGITSQQAVSRVRRICGIKKAGHTGTLDPAASGLLLIATGKATRLSEYFLNNSKGYRAVVRFGIATDTYDRDGAIVNSLDRFQISIQQIELALEKFRGEIMQVPPAASALKVNGKRSYDLFRSGQAPELPARSVKIYLLSIIGAPKQVVPDRPDVTLDIECSKGTYIRSLAKDLGDELGCPSHLANLVRTKIGEISLDQALDLQSLTVEAAETGLLDMSVAVGGLPRIDITQAEMNRFANGLPVGSDLAEPGTIAVFCAKKLIGIGIVRNNMIKPDKVLI